MEVAVERPPVKEERSATAKAEIMRSPHPIVLESFPSTQRDPSICKQNEKLEATKAEMGEVREENERLKTLLSHIVRDYQSLQMQFLDVVKLQNQPKTPPLPPPLTAVTTTDDADLVSLSLGTTSNGHRKDDKSSSTCETGHEGLSLGLSCEYDRPSTGDKAASRRPVLNLSSDSSADEGKEDGEAGEPRPPSKASNNVSNSGGDGADDEVLQQQQAKKARVSVRVKCDTPTMNDGCQWRKYGQKISKGNPCPRAYYRCTVAPSCPVRKQVQRCADDMSILITTYEGTHNHPLPPSAAAMASTTSAAATMLTTGPSTSSSHHHHPFVPAGATLLGPTTISTATSCPTITLDLTNPHSLLPASFASSTGYESKALPAAWSSGYLAYGSSPYYSKSSPAGAMARPGHEQLYQSYLQRASNLGAGAVAPAVTDTIAKAITSDPSFQSVLAAAITSYMGRSGAQK